MLNHVRTLLMNVNGGRYEDDVPGEEMVDRDYRQLVLPTALVNIRRVLFGVTPDRHMLNYRLAQFMPILHASELVQYVTRWPLITYGDADLRFAMPAYFRPRVSSLVGQLALTGGPVAPDNAGICHFNFRLKLSGTDLETTQTAPVSNITTATLNFTNGLSEAIVLGKSGYTANLPETNGEWTIDIVNRPTWDLGQIVVALESVGAPTLQTLFGAKLVEPYTTFRNLFMLHKSIPYQLAGILLALAYRTDELRVKGLVS